MENARIADILDKIGNLVELQDGNRFRVSSYRNAARTIRDLSERVEDLAGRKADLTDLANVGSSIAKKIHEILERGTCRALEELEEGIPEGFAKILNVPGLGPKKAIQLRNQLSILSLEDLRQAAEDHKIRDLKGFGVKTEQNILRGLEMLEETLGRILYHVAADYVKSLGHFFDETGVVQRWEMAGSFRRGKETVGDLDILVLTKDRTRVADLLVDRESVGEVIGRGEEKVSVRLASGLQIDVRFFEPESFGAALTYFTGSKAHGIKLRRRAQERGWKLNEYGLFKGDRRLAGHTEESVYHRLNLPWIPPELREDRGEIKAAEEGRLPDLVELTDIRGDLHCHTSATDGANTAEEMAKAASERGYSYLAVTDHSKAVRVASGLDEDALRRHADKIRELDSSLKDFWLMAGVEVDILKSGKLDLDEKVLSDLDWVVASVHSHFKLTQDEMTERVLAAVKSDVVHCLGHLSGRLIGGRGPIQLDYDRIFEACREHNVFLEIDGQPDRLDLSDIHCRRAVEAGLFFSVVSDAHRISDMDFMKYGIMTARRGWIEKRLVVNTMITRRMRKHLKR